MFIPVPKYRFNRVNVHPTLNLVKENYLCENHTYDIPRNEKRRGDYKD